MGERVAYIRVSSLEQNEARQKEALANFHIDKIFIEKASGKDTNRPQLQRMLEYIREGDTVYVTELSRLGRSTGDLPERKGKDRYRQPFWKAATHDARCHC